MIEADLLIVGSTDSSTPAAAQAARMGVKRIVLVSDIEWFGDALVDFEDRLRPGGLGYGDLKKALFEHNWT